jgi:hypothetical protein
VVPVADELVLVLAQPAMAKASATTPTPTASVLRRSPDLNLPCCGDLPMAATP